MTQSPVVDELYKLEKHLYGLDSGSKEAKLLENARIERQDMLSVIHELREALYNYRHGSAAKHPSIVHNADEALASSYKYAQGAGVSGVNVEAVARAICEADGRHPDAGGVSHDVWEEYKPHAVAALKAARLVKE